MNNWSKFINNIHDICVWPSIEIETEAKKLSDVFVLHSWLNHEIKKNVIIEKKIINKQINYTHRINELTFFSLFPDYSVSDLWIISTFEFNSWLIAASWLDFFLAKKKSMNILSPTFEMKLTNNENQGVAV